MNPDVKTQLVTALRSGDYKRGQYALRNERDEYCPNGVLCDLAVKAGIIAEPELVDGFLIKLYKYGGTESEFYDGSVAWIPRDVIEWAGIGSGKLMMLNDERNYTFEQTADWIEANL